MTELEVEIYENWNIKESFEEFVYVDEEISVNDWCESEIEYILSKCEFIEGESISEYSVALENVFSKLLDDYFSNK